METIDQYRFSEEIAGARQTIDSTLVMLRTQIQGLHNKLTTAIQDIETKGVSADLKYLGNIGDHINQIERQVKTLKDQKAHMQQILVHIEMIRNG
tara:strand:- start:154 stop:438 length:285 start_codon:yes stop_codon:yes gene_type:complete